MVITPNSKVKLIKNPLKLDSNNEMMFATSTAQYNYFNSLTKLEFDSLTYVRKDDVLRIPTDETGVGVTYEKLLQYNFCMYQNTAFASKWFYAFIDDVKWINPSLTEVHLKTAYFQTWQFDLVYKDSFIEREHVNDDTIGKHTIPENLETGEYINSETIDLYSASSSYICVGVSEVLDDIANQLSVNPRIIVYNGIYSGIKYLLCDSPLAAANLIRAYDGLGKGDGIYTIFLIPQNFLGTITFTTVNITIDSSHTITTSLAAIPTSDTAYLLNTSSSYTPPSTIDSYSPKNNKLKIYPYCYLYVTNNIGNDVVYHYEDFVSNSASFKTYGSISQGCSIKTIPLNYKKLADASSPSQTLKSFNYGVVGAKFPLCSWITDPYTNWLTQNGINVAGTTLNAQEAQMGASIGSMLLGGILLATGVGGMAGAGLLAGGAAGVFNSMQTNYQHDIIPQQAKGSISSGDIQYSTGSTKIQLFKCTIRNEYAKAIDGYFNMFGYKVNRVGTPHLHARTYYDFIKTMDVNIEGDVPETDLEEIRKMFNNGIRFWHDTTKYLDFSVTNSIIT